MNSSKFYLFECSGGHGSAKASLRQRSYSEISPGISSFKKNATAGAEAILREANAVITKGVPTDRRKDTRTFLGAAAGVRLLEKTNAEEAKALMAAVKKEVASPALEGVVESPNDDVVVLSDADEGFFQWLAVNYLMGIFSKEDSTQPSDSQSVLGVVDLDDASTLMTFVPQVEEQNVEGVRQRMAFGHNYHLYSHSHLCYGMTTIRARYLALLTEGSDLNGTVVSPCHQRGLTVEVASDDVFQTPCVTSTGEDVMGPSIPKPSVVPAKIKFKGDYNASTCGRVIAAIFANGFFAKVHHPRLKGNFTAVHKLGEIVTSYKKANHTGKVTQTDFGAEIDKFCTRKWTNLSPEEQDTAEDRCLQGWIVRELMEAYGFKNDTDWEKVTFVGGVDESAMSWSTGYALRKPRPPSMGSIEITTFEVPTDNPVLAIALTVIFSIIGGISVIVCVVECCFSCCEEEDEEPAPQKSARQKPTNSKPPTRSAGTQTSMPVLPQQVPYPPNWERQ
ncbi:unnamed protein product [Taenia asiatica]|uniref:Uncharacterized protein n=1 Tax=Taenia asiatica TaxID=60517 RepID=A0A3P6Q556_TAEAS|nr:unnamed protein product [Taenia asiatica]